MLIAALAIWALSDTRQDILGQARIEAHTAAEVGAAYRHWNSALGGVYVPVTETSPPESAPRRAWPSGISTTPAGKRLTLVNHAYMQRQAHELMRLQHTIQRHLVSLKPAQRAKQSRCLGKQSVAGPCERTA